jgi:AmmeMemoRadiSam system protein A
MSPIASPGASGWSGRRGSLAQVDVDGAGPISPALTAARRRALLDLALGTIAQVLLTGRRRLPDVSELPGWALVPAATFVSLHRSGALLGCIGALEPHQPLGRDVAEHALNAAFDDPRLPPIDGDDFDGMEIEISVLGPMQPLRVSRDGTEGVTSWRELTATLRPGVDGLLVRSGVRRATFLPAVWRSVAGADDFLALLWRKAGLSSRDWPADLQLWTYQVTECEDPGPRDLGAWAS